MKKVSFKDFWETITAGIYQSICWLCNLCGYKDKSYYGLFIKRVFTGCVTILMLAITVCLLREIYNDYHRRHAYEGIDFVNQQWVSRQVMYNESKKKVEDAHTGKTLIKNVDWIQKSVDGDSLVCFSSKGKRGYFNKFTGKVVIQPQFSKAWIFSDGLACVEDKDTLFFINHQGKRAFQKGFFYNNNSNGYTFHDGNCLMAMDNYKYGVIDKQGNWTLSPIYDDIRFQERGYWVVQKDKKLGLYNDSTKKMVLPIEYLHIDVDREGIVVQYPNFTMKRLNFDLSIKDDFVFTEAYSVMYSSGKFDKNGEDIMLQSTCFYYITGSEKDDGTQKQGLMSPQGIPLTPPIYDDILGMGKDLYKARIGNNYVILDNKGNKVK